MRKTVIYSLCVISSILLMACGKKNTDTAIINTLLTDYSENDIAMEQMSLENMPQDDTSEETKTEAEPENTEAQTEVLTKTQTEVQTEAHTEVQEEILQGGGEASEPQVVNEEINNNVEIEVEQPVVQETSRYTDTGDEKLNNQCDRVLDSIISDSMSEREKAYAIYTWVENHIRYSGNTAENGWVSGAKTTLASGKGNCYGYYSASAALLTRAGFDNLQVNEPDYSHYWNLVKVDGNWYHWDTTTGWGGERFLFTDAQMDAYSYYNASIGETLVYTWDHSSVPKTP